MKKLLTLFAAVAIVAAAAQAKGNDNLATTVLKADVTCQNCANKIMNNVPSLGKGIKDVNVDVDKKLVTVTYDKSKNNAENLIKGLASLNVAASESSTSAATLAAAGDGVKTAKCGKAGGDCSKKKDKKDCCKKAKKCKKDGKKKCDKAEKQCAGSLADCKKASEQCSKAASAGCAKTACAKADAKCAKAEAKKDCCKKD